jgi:Zn-dependent protease with chaperone function
MKLIFSILLIAFPLLGIAQLTFELKGTVGKKISSSLSEGKSVELSSIDYDDFIGSFRAKLLSAGQQETVELKQLDKINFNPLNLREFWQCQYVKTQSFATVLNKGLQYKLRKELEGESLEYLNYCKKNNFIFEDSYLESYIYSLIYKIYPDKLNDGRPGMLNVHITKDLTPNASIFPNGSLFISTGLLSIINSEEELLAVLAHEVAHFVLDHSIDNINAVVERQKRAEFWAGFATLAAASVEIYSAMNNKYYNPGALTINTAILAYGLAESVGQRFGLKYSRKQEIEADKCASELLKFIKINPTALSSALSKIKKHCIENGNYLALSGEGTHPSIDDRINAIGQPIEFNDVNYDRTISFVNTFNAELEFYNQHYTACKVLSERNVKSNVATEEDYIMLAMVNIFMYDNTEKNNEALKYLNTAKQIAVYPSIKLPKHEAIVLIRLKKYEEAKSCLSKYRELLDGEMKNILKNATNGDESVLKSFLYNEVEWTQKMIYKLRAF